MPVAVSKCSSKISSKISYALVDDFRWHCLLQGPNAGLADSVDSPTLPCLGRLCKAGKTGLAKSSSSFEVGFIGGIYWWDISVEYIGGIYWWDIFEVRYIGGTCWWDISLEYIGEIRWLCKADGKNGLAKSFNSFKVVKV